MVTYAHICYDGAGTHIVDAKRTNSEESSPDLPSGKTASESPPGLKMQFRLWADIE